MSENKTLKERLYNTFVWIAGSDPSILSRCDRYEHIKHTGLGGLILIPTIMALVSMPFAINMLDAPLHYCLLIGAFWAAFIFAIDRSIVSNMRKGGASKSLSRGSLALRLIFATALGFVIADPLVLRLFEPTINEALTQKEKNDRLFLQMEFDSLVNLEVAKKDSFQVHVIEPAEEKNAVFLQLYQWEKNGEERLVIYEGIEYTTSGYGGIRDRAKKYENAYNRSDAIVKQLWDEREKLQNRVDSNVTRLEREMIKELDKLNSELSRDYLTRAKYLHKIASEDSSIKMRKWFLVIFLVLIDIIPVLFKAILPPSQYDYRLIESEDAAQKIIQHFYQKEVKTKEFFVNEVSDFKHKEITKIFKESDTDDRTLGERLDELERLTNLKWGE